MLVPGGCIFCTSLPRLLSLKKMKLIQNKWQTFNRFVSGCHVLWQVYEPELNDAAAHAERSTLQKQLVSRGSASRIALWCSRLQPCRCRCVCPMLPHLVPVAGLQPHLGATNVSLQLHFVVVLQRVSCLHYQPFATLPPAGLKLPALLESGECACAPCCNRAIKTTKLINQVPFFRCS